MARSSPAANAALRPQEFAALAAYRQALRHFIHFSTEAAGEVGLSQQQYQVLLAVKATPEGRLLTIGDLAETMLIRHHSAVGLVDRLTRRGWLRRVADPTDARRVRIRLTSAGNRVLGRLAAVHYNELRRLGPQLVQALQSLGVGKA